MSTHTIGGKRKQLVGLFITSRSADQTISFGYVTFNKLVLKRKKKKEEISPESAFILGEVI